MSINDEIGHMSGGQSHLWRGERRNAIVAAHKFDETRSGFELKGDYTRLPQEALAAAIASEIFENHLIMDVDPTPIIRHCAREILERAFCEQPQKLLVSFFGNAIDVVPTVAAIGWLSRAFDAGITEGDLIAWGVDPFVVIQLKWWQRQPGETLLNQHIRAQRNGWALRWLAEAERDCYRNLYAFKDGFPEPWPTRHAEELKQIDALFEFFGTGPKGNQEPQPAELSEKDAKAWAAAFAAEPMEKIAPDAKGRWGMLPKQGLDAGQLREPIYTVARYLQQIGIKPKDWPTVADDFFVRVGDL